MAVWFRRAALIALLPLMAACGFLEQKTLPPPCPRVAILGDAQKGTLYRPGPGRDLTDVAYEYELLDFTGTCKYEDKNYNSVTVTFLLQVAATRGPAAEGREAKVPYFVAVVGKDQQVLVRQNFTATVPFPQGRRRVAVGEELEQNIPLNGLSSREVEVLIGLELTPEQLEGNRRRRGF